MKPLSPRKVPIVSPQRLPDIQIFQVYPNLLIRVLLMIKMITPVLIHFLRVKMARWSLFPGGARRKTRLQYLCHAS